MRVYERYCAHLHANNALDFDDLLLEARALLAEDAEALAYLAGRFRYIHVDEFQDTNAVQFDLIRMLASVHGNLFAVGDDDQSIYGWRGAKIENILHFEQTFPKAKIYKLQQNYRSTGAILALANASIAHNAHRSRKQLWTEGDAGEKPVYFEADEETGEALYCARIIHELILQGYKRSDFAVLMRINALTRAYEQEFTKYGISYKVFGGFKFFERKEIKDILAYLRLISNPFDSEACLRVINVPRRGIGEKTLAALNDYAAREELSVFDAVLAADELPVTSGAREKLRAFAKYLRELVVLSQSASVSALVKHILESSGMLEQYADNSDESLTKRANLAEFQNSVDEYVRMNGEATLSEYLQQISLYSDTDEMEEGDYVTIATIHAVKGSGGSCTSPSPAPRSGCISPAPVPAISTGGGNPRCARSSSKRSAGSSPTAPPPQSAPSTAANASAATAEGGTATGATAATTAATAKETSKILRATIRTAASRSTRKRRSPPSHSAGGVCR